MADSSLLPEETLFVGKKSFPKLSGPPEPPLPLSEQAQAQLPDRAPQRPLQQPQQRLGRLQSSLYLFAALVSYTGGGILVNWSVKVSLPDVARVTAVHLPPREPAQEGCACLGAQLALSETALVVEDVEPDGVASTYGLLQGDELIRVSQEEWVIYDSKAHNGPVDSTLRRDVRAYLVNNPGEEIGQQNINPQQPLALTFSKQGIMMKKGEPYLGLSLVLMKTLLGLIILLPVVFLTGSQEIWVAVSPGALKTFALPALGWTLADLCEIMANGKMNAAIYSVLSQLRLCGTALAMYLMLGQQQTFSQVSVLASLSLLIFCYLQVPDAVGTSEMWNGFGSPKDPNKGAGQEDTPAIGYFFALAKIFLSIFVGVLGQKALQNPALKDLSVLAMHITIYSSSLVLMIPTTIVYMVATGWHHGFFGGEVVELRHCNLDWTGWAERRCLEQAPIIVSQGWDYRTIVVVLFYIYRDVSINVVLKAFDSLIKNLVNAGATVATYVLCLVIPPQKAFNVSKFGLILVVSFQIQQYAWAPKWVPDDTRAGVEALGNTGSSGAAGAGSGPAKCSPLLREEEGTEQKTGYDEREEESNAVAPHSTNIELQAVRKGDV